MLLLALTSILGDCRKRIYRVAPDFWLASRRDGGRIASDVTAVVTPKPSTSKGVCSLTEIAFGLMSDLQRQGCAEIESTGTMISPKIAEKYFSGCTL
jgi:hypothetical protein